MSIPTRSFFWTAPALIAVLYVHLHLQLLKLWRSLAAAPAAVDGRRLEDAAFPGLMADYALSLRPDAAAAPHALTGLSRAVVLLVWLAAPLVLLGLWWLSAIRAPCCRATARRGRKSSFGLAGWRRRRRWN